MLRSTTKILGYRLNAQDGEVGRCVDFLLEQTSWLLRYVVVDAGTRLDGRPVLVSPLGLRKLEWTSRRWVLEGTRSQVEAEVAGAPELQSLQRLIGFGLDDDAGNVGYIEDLIVDDDTWQCRYLVVNGEIRLRGRRALVPTHWVSRMLLDEHRLLAPVSRSQVEGTPEYRPEAPVYHLDAPATQQEPWPLRSHRSGALGRRFNPPLGWAQAVQVGVKRGVQWGTRALEAALARSSQGRQ